MDDHPAANFIADRAYLFEEENQIVPEGLRINVLIAVKGGLELVEGETFLGARQSGNHILCYELLLGFVHCIVSFTRLFDIPGGIFFLCTGTFQDEQVKCQKCCPLEP